MSDELPPLRGCECGFAPRAKSRESHRKSMYKHKNFRCRLRIATPSDRLTPKNGRFDSAAALDFLVAAWR